MQRARPRELRRAPVSKGRVAGFPAPDAAQRPSRVHQEPRPNVLCPSPHKDRTARTSLPHPRATAAATTQNRLLPALRHGPEREHGASGTAAAREAGLPSQVLGSVRPESREEGKQRPARVSDTGASGHLGLRGEPQPRCGPSTDPPSGEAGHTEAAGRVFHDPCDRPGRLGPLGLPAGSGCSQDTRKAWLRLSPWQAQPLAGRWLQEGGR